MVLIKRWSFLGGGLMYCKSCLIAIQSFNLGGLYLQVVFVQRWSIRRWKPIRSVQLITIQSIPPFQSTIPFHWIQTPGCGCPSCGCISGCPLLLWLYQWLSLLRLHQWLSLLWLSLLNIGMQLGLRLNHGQCDNVSMYGLWSLIRSWWRSQLYSMLRYVHYCIL